jgi:hypothetical protein
VKKSLSILAVIGVAVFAFGLIIKKTDASKPVFNTGSQDELENAKRISLGILRDRAAQRALGNVDEFQVRKSRLTI